MAWHHVHALAYQGLQEELALLVGADPALLRVEDEFGWDILSFAAHAGHDDLVRWLLSSGADPSHRDRCVRSRVCRGPGGGGCPDGRPPSIIREGSCPGARSCCATARATRPQCITRQLYTSTTW